MARRGPAPYVLVDSGWLTGPEIESLSDREFRRAIDGLTRSHYHMRLAKARRQMRIERQSLKRRRPEVLRHRRAIRRARERGAPGSHTHAEWLAKIELYAGACAYCGRTDAPLCRDHVVPVAKGGTNDIDNIVPACRPCNSRKGAG